ncbi:hypothetical protein [Citrobacter sp. Cpo150]|uniref:hypothetical protein n=1 Tax=Citrobacter sp. Cpo150 TaxID=2985154 RepID=UPI002578F028|nr:hypothetical protein [Citrobacter sp. Cpo150]MDM2765760.1 hypothetical protein [Citrobacter sp. Cpo150]
MMKEYLFSVLSMLCALCYYLVLAISPEILSERIGIWLPILAIIALHFSLRRIVNAHRYQVGLVLLSAALFTFYKSFNDGALFAYALAGLYGVVLLLVAFTFPVAITQPDDDAGEQDDSEVNESAADNENPPS